MLGGGLVYGVSSAVAVEKDPMGLDIFTFGCSMMQTVSYQHRHSPFLRSYKSYHLVSREQGQYESLLFSTPLVCRGSLMQYLLSV